MRRRGGGKQRRGSRKHVAWRETAAARQETATRRRGGGKQRRGSGKHVTGQETAAARQETTMRRRGGGKQRRGSGKALEVHIVGTWGGEGDLLATDKMGYVRCVPCPGRSDHVPLFGGPTHLDQNGLFALHICIGPSEMPKTCPVHKDTIPTGTYTIKLPS
jgi:hypothetical protein